MVLLALHFKNREPSDYSIYAAVGVLKAFFVFVSLCCTYLFKAVYFFKQMFLKSVLSSFSLGFGHI